jgi:hypothetical protein
MFPNELLPEMLLKMKQEETERLLYEIRLAKMVKRKSRKPIFTRILRLFAPARNIQTAAGLNKPSARYEFVDCTHALTPCS